MEDFYHKGHREGTKNTEKNFVFSVIKLCELCG